MFGWCIQRQFSLKGLQVTIEKGFDILPLRYKQIHLFICIFKNVALGIPGTLLEMQILRSWDSFNYQKIQKCVLIFLLIVIEFGSHWLWVGSAIVLTLINRIRLLTHFEVIFLNTCYETQRCMYLNHGLDTSYIRELMTTVQVNKIMELIEGTQIVNFLICLPISCFSRIQNTKPLFYLQL